MWGGADLRRERIRRELLNLEAPTRFGVVSPTGHTHSAVLTRYYVLLQAYARLRVKPVGELRVKPVGEWTITRQP